MAEHDLAAQVTIGPANTMVGRYAVTAVHKDNLPASVAVKRQASIAGRAEVLPIRAELPGTMRVVAWAHIDGSLTVASVDEIEGILAVARHNSIPAAVTVGISNVLWGRYDIVQPPLVVQQFQPVADAFVRESRPRLNYGTASTLLVGSEPEGRFRGLLRYDLSALSPELTIQKAVLRFRSLGQAQRIGLHHIQQEWTEAGVTWRNQPAHVSMPVEILDAGDGPQTIELDVTSLAIDWIRGTTPNMGLMLRAWEEMQEATTTFCSREYTTQPMRPTLDVWYRDLRIPDRSEIRAKGQVRQAVNADLVGAAEVRSYWAFESFPAAMRVHSDDTLIGSIEVVGSNVTGSLDVRRGDWHEIEAGGTVRAADVEEFEAAMGVSRHWVPGVVAARQSAWGELEATIAVRQATSHEIPAEARISRPMLPGMVAVHEVNDLESKVAVRAWNAAEIPASIAARQTADGEIQAEGQVVGGPNDVRGSIAARRSEGADLAGSLRIRKGAGDMDSSAAVKQTGDLASSLYIRRGSGDLAGSVQALSGYLAARMAVWAHTWVAGYMTVRGQGTRDLPASVGVRQSTRGDLPATMWIRKGAGDLAGHFAIIGYGATAIPGDVTARQRDASDLDGKIAVIPEILRGRSDVAGIHAVRVTRHSDLLARTSARQRLTTDVSGTMTVRSVWQLPLNLGVSHHHSIGCTLHVSAHRNFYGFVAVRRDADGDMAGTATVSAPDHAGWLAVSRSTLDGLASVRQTGHSELEATLAVSRPVVTSLGAVSRPTLPGTVVAVQAFVHADLRGQMAVVSVAQFLSELESLLPPVLKSERGGV